MAHRPVAPRDMCQQGGGGGVEVDTHVVDHRLHNRRQPSCQCAAFKVMLILPHSQAAGVDLDQLRQRVLRSVGREGWGGVGWGGVGWGGVGGVGWGVK